MKTRAHCPACLSTSLKTVYSEPYCSAEIKRYFQRLYEGQANSAANEYHFQLVACSDCGLTFQKEIPDDRMLGEIYNEWVPGTQMESQRRDYRLDEYRYLAEQVQFIIQHFGVPPSQIPMFDFGFGWAHFSRMAMGYGCPVSGAELSEERRAHGVALGIDLIELNMLAPSKFRFINTEQVFEHLTDPREVLGLLIHALAPDGLIKISVPDASNALKKIAGGTSFGQLSPDQQMQVAPLEHINSFNADSLQAFGKSMGLKPLRPSMRKLVNSASGLLEPKALARTVLRPLYRHVYPRSTFMYFQHT